MIAGWHIQHKVYQIVRVSADDAPMREDFNLIIPQGETWSVGAQGERYQRWWGEDHFGNGWVRKHGNSNTGNQMASHC